MAKMNTTVFASDNKSEERFVRAIAQNIETCGRSQVDICRDVYGPGMKPNIIAMIKTGKTRVPLERIVPLSKAIGMDPGEALRLGLLAYYPTLLDHITTYICDN